MKHNPPQFPNQQGIALVVVLAFVVLLTIAVVAFLARATAGRQLSNSSFNQAKAEELARSALDIVTSDLKQEIANGSTVKSFGDQKIFLPTNAVCMVPKRNPAPASPNLMPTLLRISTDAIIPAPGADHPASDALSSDPAAGGRSISPARWNKHYLIPRAASATTDSDTTPISDFAAPKWVYVTDQGPEVLTAPKSSVVGRYAYAIYDEGALLDANVAGYPMNPAEVLPASSPHPTPDPQNFKKFGYGGKGVIGFADLTAIGMSTNAVTALVGWRNYASAQPSGSFNNFTFDAAGAARYFDSVMTNTNGFLKTGTTIWTPPGSGPRTDQALVSRQQLLDLQKALGFSVSALPNLGTFSRAVTTPSWSPATPAGSTIDYADLADDPDAINRNLANVRHASSATVTHYKDDGTKEPALSVRVGDPLVLRRFSLAKLAWLGHDGPNAAAFAASVTAAQQAEAIKDCFGLTWHPNSNAGNIASDARWDYQHGDANAILTLEQVRAAGREPDFFELLKAGILSGSLGGEPGPTAASLTATTTGPSGNSFTYYSGLKDRHILQIGANIIDQVDSDNYPTAIYQTYGGNPPYSAAALQFYNTVFGQENLPGISRMSPYAFKTDGDKTTDGQSDIWLYPEFWNPYSYVTADITNYPKTPTQLRIRAAFGKGDIDINEHHANDPLPGNEMSITFDFTNNPQIACFVNPAYSASATAKPSPFWDSPNLINYGPTASTGNYRSTQPSSSIKSYEFYRIEQAANPSFNPASTPTKSGKLGIWLGEFTRHAPTFESHGISITPDLTDPPTFVLDYLDDNNTWRPYAVMARLTEIQGRDDYHHSVLGDDGWSIYWALGRPDPRTDRFSAYRGFMNSGGQNFNHFWVAGSSIMASTADDPQDGGGRGGVHYLMPAETSGFVYNNPVAKGSWPRAYLLDDWAKNRVMANGPNFYYKDPDGIVRPGDAWRSDTTSSTTGDGIMLYPERIFSANNAATGPYLPTSYPRRRPIILNRPFRSVGELGYVYRDLPFKSLDFWSDKSADAGLLDLFAVRDEPAVVAGRVNINNSPASVVQAIVAGTIGSELVTPEVLSAPEASAVAQSIAAEISTNGPLANPADVVSRIGTPIYTALSNVAANNTATNRPANNKTYSEATVRALSSTVNTRTWNLMIDVIAQSGVFPPSSPQTAAALNNSFLIQGERRYWLHIAIDRISGKVIDQQMELVYE